MRFEYNRPQLEVTIGCQIDKLVLRQHEERRNPDPIKQRLLGRAIFSKMGEMQILKGADGWALAMEIVTTRKDAIRREELVARDTLHAHMAAHGDY